MPPPASRTLGNVPRAPLARLLPLALLAVLGACGPRSDAPNNPLALAMSGSLDRGADTRQKLPDGLRRMTTWKTDVPVDARELRVTYDIDQRTVGWHIDVLGARATLADLAGGRPERRGEVGGEAVSVVRGGALDGAVVRGEAPDFSLSSRNYVARYEPDLLPFVR